MLNNIYEGLVYTEIVSIDLDFIPLLSHLEPLPQQGILIAWCGGSPASVELVCKVTSFEQSIYHELVLIINHIPVQCPTHSPLQFQTYDSQVDQQ